MSRHNRREVFKDLELFTRYSEIGDLALLEETFNLIDEDAEWVVLHFVDLAFSQVPNSLRNVVERIVSLEVSRLADLRTHHGGLCASRMRSWEIEIILHEGWLGNSLFSRKLS